MLDVGAGGELDLAQEALAARDRDLGATSSAEERSCRVSRASRQRHPPGHSHHHV